MSYFIKINILLPITFFHKLEQVIFVKCVKDPTIIKLLITVTHTHKCSGILCWYRMLKDRSGVPRYYPERHKHLQVWSPANAMKYGVAISS